MLVTPPQGWGRVKTVSARARDASPLSTRNMRVSRTRGTARDGQRDMGIFDDSDVSDVEVGEEGAGQAGNSAWGPCKPLPKWSSGIEVDLRDGETLPKGMELVGTQDHVFREQDDGTMALFLPAVYANPAAHAPTRAPPVSSLVRAKLCASDHCVSLLAVRAQTSHIELKLSNVGQWMLNADGKLSTYSVLLALRANTLPLPLFGGGAVQTAGEQVQIFENGSVSILGRSVRRPSLISSVSRISKSSPPARPKP